MPSTGSANELFNPFKALSKKEREEFEYLLDSHKPIPEWQKEEVMKRLAALDKNPPNHNFENRVL
jgi:hypothetical protein